jgi:hypothetical protein
MARKSYLDLCDKPAFNEASETAPPFAVLQVTNWTEDRDGNDLFTFKKPDGKGKFYLVNGPFPIGSQKCGDATRHDGAFALLESELPTNAAELIEWGPKKDSWALSPTGKGFVLYGAVTGSPASQPGFPPTASTLRTRVSQVAVTKVTNRIQGTVAMTVSESTLAFPIQDIFVLSGVDPRPEPHSPAQSVIVQNNLKKAYVNGVDRVTATQNEADLKWYVETDPGGGGAVIYGTLKIDVTSQMPSVAVQVKFFSGENPADNEGFVVCWNPIDFIRPGLQPTETRYLFVGNAGGQVTAAKMTDGKWYLVSVQPPIKPPNRPEA